MAQGTRAVVLLLLLDLWATLLMMSSSNSVIAATVQVEPAPPAGVRPRPSRIQYYLHLEEQEHVIATANQGKTTDLDYSTLVFDLPMTERIERESRALGVVRGLSVITEGNSTARAAGRRLEELVNTILYEDGFHSGTIAQHGVIDLNRIMNNATSSSSSATTSGLEIAVVGGTGDFRCASGFSVTSLASAPPRMILFWTVHLTYNPACDYL